MDGAELSKFPHVSWLGATFSFRPEAGPTGVHLRGVAHSVSMVMTGRHSVRWVRRGHERSWVENPGTVHFRTCDWDWHDFVIHSAEPGDVLAFFLPPGHLRQIAHSEHLDGAVDWGRLLLPNDADLQRAMATLAACQAAPAEHVVRADEAARRLILRLVALSGGEKPDWHEDHSVFDRLTLGYLIEHIDAHLCRAPGLGELAVRVGLSPSHFARKWRRSTGLSLHRFINRRRVRASLAALRSDSQPLTGVALDLGFSSQSHFTRIFSEVTGLTPARYRKQSRRVVA